MIQEHVFRIEGLRKSFGPIQVLGGVDLDLRAGAVTVLMGANGAGKSTLVRIVSGVYGRDAGTITLAGEPYAPATPADAIRAGVVTVHQNINDGVVADLDVATNLTLDRLNGRGAHLIFNPRRVRREAQAVADRMGLAIDLNATVADLSLADRQMVSIARAMAHEPKVLILDERPRRCRALRQTGCSSLSTGCAPVVLLSFTFPTACPISAGLPTASSPCETAALPGCLKARHSITRVPSMPCSARRSV